MYDKYLLVFNLLYFNYNQHFNYSNNTRIIKIIIKCKIFKDISINNIEKTKLIEVIFINLSKINFFDNF